MSAPESGTHLGGEWPVGSGQFLREFVLAHGIEAYVAEVNGISVEDANKAIADGRVNVAYLRDKFEVQTA